MPKTWLEGGIATLDERGSMLSVNEPLSNWLEKPVENLLGQSFWEIMGELSPEWKQAFASLRANRAAPFTRLNLKLASTEPHPVHWFTLEMASAQEHRFVR